MSDPFTHVGKQVLSNGVHYADAADNRAAAFITERLNQRWQPIETAPRDGTGVLLSNGRMVVYGWYSDRDPAYPWVFIDDHDQVSGCGFCDRDDLVKPNACEVGHPPAHWMPLPPAPVSA